MRADDMSWRCCGCNRSDSTKEHDLCISPRTCRLRLCRPWLCESASACLRRVVGVLWSHHQWSRSLTNYLHSSRSLPHAPAVECVSAASITSVPVSTASTLTDADQFCVSCAHKTYMCMLNQKSEMAGKKHHACLCVQDQRQLRVRLALEHHQLQQVSS